MENDILLQGIFIILSLLILVLVFLYLILYSISVICLKRAKKISLSKNINGQKAASAVLKMFNLENIIINLDSQELSERGNLSVYNVETNVLSLNNSTYKEKIYSSVAIATYEACRTKLVKDHPIKIRKYAFNSKVLFASLLFLFVYTLIPLFTNFDKDNEIIYNTVFIIFVVLSFMLWFIKTNSEEKEVLILLKKVLKDLSFLNDEERKKLYQVSVHYKNTVLLRKNKVEGKILMQEENANE